MSVVSGERTEQPERTAGAVHVSAFRPTRGASAGTFCGAVEGAAEVSMFHGASTRVNFVFSGGPSHNR